MSPPPKRRLEARCCASPRFRQEREPALCPHLLRREFSRESYHAKYWNSFLLAFFTPRVCGEVL